jgi:hypothetical protein
MGVRLIFILLTCSLLSGCSLWGEVTSSLDYVNQATSYINNAADFSERVPSLAEQAVIDPQAKAALMDELERMKNTIMQFNGIEVPAFAQDIHKTLLGYNETLIKEIDGYLENKNIDLNSFANSQLMQTLNKLTQTLSQIQQLNP